MSISRPMALLASMTVGNLMPFDPAAFSSSAHAESLSGATLVVCARNALRPNRCDYRATGSNDQLVIQEAINALPGFPKGGSVALSEGTFHLAGPIEVRGGLSIYGVAVDASVLQMMQGVAGPAIRYSRPDREGWLYVADMTISGELAASGDGIDIGTSTGQLWDGRIQHIFVRDFPGNGVWLSWGWGWMLDHVASEYNKGWGLEIEGGQPGQSAFIAQSKFASNTAGGVRIAASFSGITQTWIGKNIGPGVQIDADSIRLTDSTLYENGQNGTSPNVLVSANQPYSIITSNEVVDLSTTQPGIYLSVGSRYNQVSHNQFQNIVGPPTSNIVDKGSNNAVQFNLP